MKTGAVALLVLGGVAVGAVGAILLTPKTTQAAPAIPPASGPAQVTVGPGLVGVEAAPGQQVAIALPQGASWNSLVVRALGTSGTTLSASGTAPITVTPPPSAGGSASVGYTDVAGRQQFAVLVFLPPGAQMTTVITDGPTLALVEQGIANGIARGMLPGITGASTRAQAITAFQQFITTQNLGYTVPATGNVDYETAALLAYF